MTVRVKRYCRIAAVLSLTILLCLAAGCGFMENLVSEYTESEEEQQPTVETEEEEYAPEESEDVTDTRDEERQNDMQQDETMKVSLFFADEDGNNLAAEEREIEKVEGIAQKTVSELISGPTESGLLPTVPEETVLLDINVKEEEGLCIVDFSKEFTGQNTEGVISDEITVYSVVNTLTQFSTVDRVQFRIEGQEVETLGENIPASEPLSEKKDFVVK